VKAGWETKKLGEIIQLEYGKPLADSERNPNGLYPAYGANGIKDRTDKFYKGEPSIIVGRKGSAGEVTLTEEKYWPLDVTFFVEFDRAKYELQYLYFLLLTLNLPSMAKGVKPGINRNDVYDITVTTPDIEEQRRIVTLLDEAFADIATAKANAEKNLQNARELFSNQLSLALIQSGPDWVATTVGETCTLKSGTTVPTSIERPDGEIPYVKVAEMSMPENAEGICTSIRFLDRNDVKNGWLIPAGAVIFPKRGGAILTNKKRLVLREMCADLNIMSVIPSEVLTPEFLYFYFLNVDMRALGTGSSIPQINNYDIAPLKISFPKFKEKQVELTEMLRSIEAECHSLEAIYRLKLTSLDDLKKSLLHQAFSGQLTQ
jgi:type I restriction enzyme S subunit